MFFLTVSSVQAQEATLSFSSPSKTIQEGDRITVSVVLSTPRTSVNAASGVVSFSDTMLRVVSITKNRSIFNLWTKEPSVQRNKVVFEGVAVNPGFQGTNGQLFQITFEARRNGIALLDFSEGAVLANDGLGTTLTSTLKPYSFSITKQQGGFLGEEIETPPQVAQKTPSRRLTPLPVITEFSEAVDTATPFFVKGKGHPQALTKIVFEDTSVKSLGEQFVASLQKERQKPTEVLVKNNDQGEFEYIAPANIIAGAYSATPYLVDETSQTEKPGFGVQILVSESKVVQRLVVLINILILLIPIVGLGVLIYFIPWYSRLRMKIIKKRLHLEEEKIGLSEKKVVHEEEQIG